MTRRVITARNLSKVRGSITRPADVTQYAVGDAVSASDDSHWTIGYDPEIAVGNSGRIIKVGFASSVFASTGLGVNLMFFSQDIATMTDNAAASVTDAELLTCFGVAVISAAAYAPGGGLNQIQWVDPTGGNFLVNRKSPSLYIQGVATNTYTPPAVSEVLSVLVDIEWD